MSIKRKPDGKYQARWRDPDGRQRAKSFARRVDAEKFMATVVVKMSTGTYVDPMAGRETVGIYADRWAEGQPWRITTREHRERIIEQHIRPTFGSMRLAGVRRSDVQSWVGRLTASGAAPSSVTTYYRVLASIMRSAATDRLIGESPCHGIKLPTDGAASSSVVPLTVDQVHALADEVPDRYRALVIASAGLGLRQGEACALTTDRVHFLKRYVTIDRQVVTTGGGDPYFGPTKTPKSNRRVPLSSVVADALALHIERHAIGPTDLLFTASTGAMLSRQTWHSAFSSAARRLGIDASSHDLRHHAASLLISSGCSPKAVAEFLGHKNATETLNTYSHLWPSDEDKLRQAIDDGLGRRDVHEMCTTATSAV